MMHGMVWARGMLNTWPPPTDHGEGLFDNRGTKNKGGGGSWGSEPVSHPMQRVLKAWLTGRVFHWTHFPR